ncbi:MAG TPA: secretin N-terminal domain-containing protein [Vicinamibacterales bacterium]
MSSPTRGADVRRAARLRWSALLLLTLLATGCAAGQAFKRGQAAERVDDYDRAVAEYSQALREDPDNQDIRLALNRVKLRASELHFNRGRRLSATGKYEEALVELQIAAELNPTNGEVDAELRRTRTALRNKIAVSRDGQTRLETLVEKSREYRPEGYEVPEVVLPPSLVFRDASAREVLTALARFADVNIAFDPAFRDVPITIELRDSTFAAALDAVTSSIRAFYRVTSPRTITIVPDTAAKRREYEDEVVRTFYLSNADLKETIDLLRIVVDLRRVAGIPGTNAITIKDTPERLAAAGRIIQAIDKARPEVVIDVELLEVDRRRLREYGIQLASPTSTGLSPGIDGAADVNQEGLTLEGLRRLSQADVFVTGVPGIYYRLLKQDSSTRTLANPQLRTAEGIPAQARFGERVPVPVTTFSPIATGGVPQQPVTSFNYENIGVNIDITPRMHHNDEVSLALKVEVSSVSGTGFGGLPTFGNRSITTVIRLRDGETNMLAGLIRDDERRVLEGVPGLSDLPIVGRLFSRNRRETQETDIVLTLTPHIIRVLDLTEDDLRPFRVGRDPGPSITDLPAAPPQIPGLPGQQQPEEQEPPVPTQPQPPRDQQRPIQPITPPEPPPQPEPPPPQNP